jgi:tRNA(fMet)-specific endonuclease VapC
MVIDTGIFIDHLRAKEKTKTILYQIFGTKPLLVSAVTAFELLAGATTEPKQRELHSILSNFTILEFNNLVSFRAADIYRQLRSQNKLIEFRDIFIAATCLEYQQPLLTFNHKHFTRISGLELVQL